MKCRSNNAMYRSMALFTAGCMLLMLALLLFSTNDTLAASDKDGAAKPNSGKVDTKTGDDKAKTTPKPADDNGKGNATPEDKGKPNPDTTKPGNPNPGNDKGNPAPGNGNADNSNPATPKPATPAPGNSDQDKGNTSNSNGNDIKPVNTAPATSKPSNGNSSKGNSSGNNGNGSASQGNAGKITLCHATGSAKHPYVFITVSKNAAGPDAVAGHSKHPDDIIPAGSLADCPKTIPDDEANNPGSGSDNPGNGDNTGDNDHEKIGLCHATGSATNPYVFIVVSVNAAGPDAVAGHSKHADDIIPANSIDDCPKPASGGNNPGDTTGGTGGTSPGDTTGGNNPGDTTGGNNPGDTTGGNPGNYNPGDTTTGGTNPAPESGNPPAQLPGTVGGTSPLAPASSTTAPDSVAPAQSNGSQDTLVVANIPASQPEQPSAVLGAVKAPDQPQALAPAFLTLQPLGAGAIPGLPNTGGGFLANLQLGTFNFANQGLSSWISILGLAGLLAMVSVIELARMRSKTKAKK